jgi:probable H4MPT-linked C1 transfer pathway protein
MTNDTHIIGWDVGGANLKAVLISADSGVIDAFQLPCPLWRGLDELEKAIDQILSLIVAYPAHHAITMTGELVDLFANRHDGVISIANLMQETLDGNLYFYAGQHGFVRHPLVFKQTHQIASANWHASAKYAAQMFRQGLMLDIGSTTSDFVMLSDGEVNAIGFSDAERMRENTLVYTGVVRTPLMALASRIEFEGALCNVAAEYFATTADVYRLTGDLLSNDDIAETADGGGKSLFESARRIARMIGHDVEDAEMPSWLRLANSFKVAQLKRLEEAAKANFASLGYTKEAPLIGAGAGRFLIKQMAERMQRPYVDISSMIKAQSPLQQNFAGICLPAYAVAYLLAKKVC